MYPVVHQLNYESSGSSSREEFTDSDTEYYKKCYACTEWDFELICCLTCKRSYHNDCHIPKIPISTSAEMESWICTLCIDIDHVSKVMSEGTSDPNRKTLDKNEISMASRILLELICDSENSSPFLKGPPVYSNPVYYHVIMLPVTLYSVRRRLSSEINYYTSFSDVIVDVKRIYSNALFFYSSSDPYNIMAQKQQMLLFEMLTKWVPQYHTVPKT